MQSAGVDPAAVDAGAVGFRLAPRLNAAGRLGHPREALELLLTEDEAEARRLADSLEELNRERQAVEGRILREAVAQVEAWPPERRARRAYAVAGADWHEGVIGIVASRLVERYHRPVVLIAGAEGDWKGSGRSIPAFDLHAALGACAGLLGRWGGHRAAAGLSIAEENVEAFAEAFAEHAAAVLDDADLEPVTSIDAVVGARSRALPRPLRRARADSRRSGSATPRRRCSLPAVGLAELATVGDGKHLRFRIRRAGRDGGQRDRLRSGVAPRRAAARRALRRRVPARGEPLERHGRAAARRPPRLPDRRRAISSSANGSSANGRSPPPPRRRGGGDLRRARGSTTHVGVRRDLLESPRFRALLGGSRSPARPSAA